MECARGVAKRQRVSTVASALANIDVLGLLATFLDADELCQVKATCKALGSRDESAFEGLSMTEEAARRIFEQSASDEEKALLPRNDGEEAEVRKRRFLGNNFVTRTNYILGQTTLKFRLDYRR